LITSDRGKVHSTYIILSSGWQHKFFSGCIRVKVFIRDIFHISNKFSRKIHIILTTVPKYPKRNRNVLSTFIFYCFFPTLFSGMITFKCIYPPRVYCDVYAVLFIYFSFLDATLRRPTKNPREYFLGQLVYSHIQ